jgi:hypothetical protein
MEFFLLHGLSEAFATPHWPESALVAKIWVQLAGLL